MSGDVVERDIFEVANQLCGFVGPDTEDHLAAFLIREGKEAGKLADLITSQAAEIEQLRKENVEALQAVDAFSDICVELGVERDNEAGLIAAAELKRQLAEARAALEPFADEADRLELLIPSASNDMIVSGMGNVAVSDFRRARTLTNGGENGR